MLSWLRRRPERFERIEIEADALIRDLGADAYSLAGGGSARLVRTRGEILEPSCVDRSAQDGIPVSLVTPTQMAIDAHFASE